MRAAFRAKIAAFAPVFASVKWRDPPLGNALWVFRVQRAVNAIVAFRELLDTKGELLTDNLKGNITSAFDFTLEDQARAHAQQTAIYRAMVGFFREVDLLITPTMAFPPHAVEQNFPADAGGVKLANHYAGAALTHLLSVPAGPSMSIPCGRDPTGAPFGLQLAAAPRADRFLLGVAAALEPVFAGNPELARPVPDIAGLM